MMPVFDFVASIMADVKGYVSPAGTENFYGKSP
jgi:hypothetical protein